MRFAGKHAREYRFHRIDQNRPYQWQNDQLWVSFHAVRHFLQVRMSLGTSATSPGRAVSFEPQHGESRPHAPDHGCVRGPYTATDTCVRGFYRCQQSIFEGCGVAVAWFHGARSSPPHMREEYRLFQGDPLLYS